jgi:hypothetical protein
MITFEERSSGEPEAIKYWFYPADESGFQFVYPQKRASEIAKRSNQTVLAMRNEMTAHIATQSTSAGDSSIQQLGKTKVSGVSPSGSSVEKTSVVSTKPAK